MNLFRQFREYQLTDSAELINSFRIYKHFLISVCDIISKAQKLIEVFLILIGQKVFNVDRRTYFLKNSWSYVRLCVYAARQVSNAVHRIANSTNKFLLF